MSVYGSYTRIPNPTLINSLQNNTKDKSFRVCHEKIRVNKRYSRARDEFCNRARGVWGLEIQKSKEVRVELISIYLNKNHIQ